MKAFLTVILLLSPGLARAQTDVDLASLKLGVESCLRQADANRGVVPEENREQCKAISTEWHRRANLGKPPGQNSAEWQADQATIKNLGAKLKK